MEYRTYECRNVAMWTTKRNNDIVNLSRRAGIKSTWKNHIIIIIYLIS